MAATILEFRESRSFTAKGEKRVYKVMGTLEETEVRDLLLGYAPLTTELGFLRLDYSASPKGGGFWDCSIDYGLGERAEQGAPGETSQETKPTDSIGLETSFDTTGATEHITQSILTLESAKAVGDARDIPNFNRAIGVSRSGVAGCDVPAPKLDWSETWTFPIASITWEYVKRLADMTGSANNATFRTNPAKSVIFRGASGASVDKDKYKITYLFGYSKNRTGEDGVEIAPAFNPIDKNGWEYLWCFYEDSAGTDSIVQVPRAVYVEKVLEDGDFSEIGIGL